jgi:hypothetical protein
MSDPDSDIRRETRSNYDPVTGSTTQVTTERRSSGAGWWVLGLAAVAVLAAVTFLATRPPASAGPNDQSLAAATALGAAQQSAQQAQASAAAAQAGSLAAQAQAIRPASPPPDTGPRQSQGSSDSESRNPPSSSSPAPQSDSNPPN